MIHIPIESMNLMLERAQLLLFTTDKAVKEVAYMLGFSDENYFIRLFRKLMDTTPQEYRRSLRL